MSSNPSKLSNSQREEIMFVRRRLGDVLVREKDGPGARPEQTNDSFHEGRLPYAVSS